MPCGLNEKMTPREILCHTWFVRIFSHPGYCYSSYLRVTKAQKESAVGFGHQHVLGLLLVHKAQDSAKEREKRDI